MMFLLDVALLPHAAASERLSDWLLLNGKRCHLAAPGVARLSAAVERLRLRGAVRRAGDVKAWLDTLLHLYGDRILPFDTEAARRTGGLPVPAGPPVAFEHKTMAGIALAHDLKVATRMTAPYMRLGVPFLDPIATTVVTELAGAAGR